MSRCYPSTASIGGASDRGSLRFRESKAVRRGRPAPADGDGAAEQRRL
jgi:hypothetical protein